MIVDENQKLYLFIMNKARKFITGSFKMMILIILNKHIRKSIQIKLNTFAKRASNQIIRKFIFLLTLHKSSNMICKQKNSAKQKRLSLPKMDFLLQFQLGPDNTMKTSKTS